MSFCVHTEKNVWACQSLSCQQARGGRIGGTILDLVAEMEQSSLRQAALRIQAWLQGGKGTEGSANRFGATAKGNWLQKEEGVAGDRGNRVLPFVLRLQPSHPYLEQRGVRPQTARWFGVGFYPGRGLLSGRVVFPIHDERAALVAYAGRAVDGSEPKYKLPAGFRKGLVLFNIHRAAAVAGTNRVIVVEGFFDCLHVHQAGYPAVVALMGTTLSDYQARLLLERFAEAVLMLDGDAAGRRASRIIARRLSAVMAVTTATVPAGRQPDQMSSEEIQQLLWTDFAAAIRA
jgi:DNA primase